MEPVTSIVSAILVVLQEIDEAERAARRNRARCRDLAERARAVSNVLRDSDSRTTAPGVVDGASSSRRIALRKLRQALDDALMLVRSCGRLQRGDDRRLLLSWSWLSARLDGSRAQATARFDDVDTRIDNCLAELNAASGAVIVEQKIDSCLVAATAENGGRKGGGQRNGGNCGKPTRGRKNEAVAAAVGRPTPGLVLARAGVVPFPPFWLSVEEDPTTSCSVM